LSRPLAAAAILGACLAGSCDPVHDDARSALGGEAPGISPGPLHRAGQPCLTCHDGAATDPPQFSVAGTVFLYGNSLAPAVGATLLLTDASGATASATTNAVGNFYLTPGAFAPRFPLYLSRVALGSAVVSMQSHIGRNGSCAGCHADPAGPDSPGHVYVTVLGATP
jgi:hypothetical protein